MKKMHVTTLLAACLFANMAWAAEHTVEMKNAGKDGAMVFEPAVLNVAVGDTVSFVPTDDFHNAESVAGLTPAGSVTWTGEMSKKVSVTVDKEGVYVYKCLPHVVMAMVGVIVAGKPTNLDDVKKNAAALTASFAMNKDRLDTYLAQLK
jgi:pseudoazurin